MPRDDTPNLMFAVFNEIAIIQQLSSTLLEDKLPHGFLTSHFAVLNHLIRVRDGATPLQMARAFQVPKTTMTHTLAGLEKHGLVQFRPNPEDARSKQVWLTEAGRAFQAKAISDLGPHIARIEAALPGMAAKLIGPLTELRRWLDADRDGPPG